MSSLGVRIRRRPHLFSLVFQRKSYDRQRGLGFELNAKASSYKASAKILHVIE